MGTRDRCGTGPRKRTSQLGHPCAGSRQLAAALGFAAAYLHLASSKIPGLHEANTVVLASFCPHIRDLGLLRPEGRNTRSQILQSRQIPGFLPKQLIGNTNLPAAPVRTVHYIYGHGRASRQAQRHCRCEHRATRGAHTRQGHSVLSGGTPASILRSAYERHSAASRRLGLPRVLGRAAPLPPAPEAPPDKARLAGMSQRRAW